MKSRVIKRAKRRGVVAVDDEATANKPALFTGFGGELCHAISIFHIILCHCIKEFLYAKTIASI